MLGELVQTETSDGIILDGFLASRNATNNEAWVLLHGVNSNFYSSSLLRGLASQLHSAGDTVVLANTRGHDILSFNTGAVPSRLGSQIELLEGAIADLTAWFDFLRKRGYSSVSVLGHSLGALKAIYWGTKLAESKLRPSRLIAISPPRLNTQVLLNDPIKGEVFRGHLQDALELCASGNPDRVMKVRFPLPMWICASTYADKYGSGEKYDYMSLAEKVTCPALWVFGENEVRNGSANFLDADVRLAEILNSNKFAQRGNQDVQVIARADHSYRDRREMLGKAIEDWLNT